METDMGHEVVAGRGRDKERPLAMFTSVYGVKSKGNTIRAETELKAQIHATKSLCSFELL